ncbi:outer membrane lipoprotein carrier protein LolA [Treponema sp. C6A8]|uniref:LolA family protein n=1 Tax=Treponema sp. C6A8 TaxID=1410609 RepID=UPI000481937C|nr:outer membrane lipoprotein carrier protein LolA [Treponema sp. C6A8]
MKKILLSLILCLFAGTSIFSATFEQACSVMSPESQIKGDFVQKRRIASNGRSLKSSGIFTVGNGEIVWQTQKPVKNTVTITKGKITTTDSRGKETVLDSSQSQVFTLISKMMASLFAGNREQLQEYFLIDFDGSLGDNPAHWKTILTPRDSTIAQAVSRIILTGNLDYMLSMESILANGDSILYEFLNHEKA